MSPWIDLDLRIGDTQQFKVLQRLCASDRRGAANRSRKEMAGLMTNLGDLEIFARVVSTGSMSAAGRALGLSAAVISKRVKRLEEGLGTRLLQRTTRQVSLTEAGQGFYDRVLGVLAGIEEAEAYASGRSSQAQGTLRITAPTSFGRMHIACSNSKCYSDLCASDKTRGAVGSAISVHFPRGGGGFGERQARRRSPRRARQGRSARWDRPEARG